MSDFEIVPVDYNDPQHTADLVALLNHYASEDEGGGVPLSDSVQSSLASRLAERTDANSVLAYVEGRAAGLMNCIEGFSTFKAKPLLNIHDMVVHRDFRRRGIASALLKAAEQIARDRGCCKITLEVLSENGGAISAYEKFGFRAYQLDPRFGHALFMEMPIDE